MVTEVKPLQIYLKTSTSQFLRFLWFHGYKPNEMMLRINGLSSKIPVLNSISSDRIVTNDDLRALRFNYADATIINEKIDHISCHADGTFHIKTRGEKQVYRDTVRRQEPLGIKTKTFLDFIIMSDRARKYTNGISNPHSPYFQLPCDENDFYIIWGKFSGARHPVESELANEIFPSGGYGMFFRLNGKYLKGVLFPLKMRIGDAMFRNRPAGTLLILRFPRQDNKYLLKGFSFT